MGRFSPSHSYAHRCRRLHENEYRISWTYDRYYEGSRLRWPTRGQRDVDEQGARRFCKRWGIAFPKS
jgi:hypothetical protein